MIIPVLIHSVSICVIRVLFWLNTDDADWTDLNGFFILVCDHPLHLCYPCSFYYPDLTSNYSLPFIVEDRIISNTKIFSFIKGCIYHRLRARYIVNGFG
jgi:hypothetical protein